MSVDLDRQLREYCRQMDEQQGALSFQDILDGPGGMQVIPRPAEPQPTPRGPWVAAAVAALVVLIALIGIRFLPATDQNLGTLDQPTTTSGPEAPVDPLPALRMPGTRIEPAGDFGWTGEHGTEGWMHRVIEDPPGYRQTQLRFAVKDDCFVGDQGADPTAVNVAGLDGLYFEPFDGDDGVWGTSMPGGGETTGAYSLAIGDRTLCVYLRWEAATTPDELRSAREVVESIRGEPFGENGVRINFTLPAGWDTG